MAERTGLLYGGGAVSDGTVSARARVAAPDAVKDQREQESGNEGRDDDRHQWYYTCKRLHYLAGALPSLTLGSGGHILPHMGTLYLVATPIGNLGDITLRALEALRGADAIACEDTRHTLKLLNHFQIRKPLLSCHANDESRGADRILGLLAQGKTVAYCSDAGTPGLSDPGAVLACRARENGHSVSPLPGPSAFAALICAAGMGGRSFLFDGFPSPKAGKRRARVVELMRREECFVLYESPHRIIVLMEEIAIADPARRVCLGREITKIHEEFLVGSASEVLEALKTNTEVRGEFSVLVAGTELA